ncbi:hypothetical protein L596_009038 [Steinernema carpocapsae]|uniref:Uncharacterized protein n=1 Tax=Steinernema carpocapsae TaxID=34508 RepID=A0A4U5PEE1_STECR|nr:hypothetical protein L596_009038 [Steinernema carpocapsae]
MDLQPEKPKEELPTAKTPSHSHSSSDSDKKSSTRSPDADTVCLGIDDLSSRSLSSPSADDINEVTDEMVKLVWRDESRDHGEFSQAKIVDEVQKGIYKKLKFTRKAIIYPQPKIRQARHQRINRMRIDEWRRYGCVKKLHEIGGWTFEPTWFIPQTSAEQLMSRQNFTKVDPNSTPPPEPECPPIMTEEELLQRPLLIAVPNPGGIRPFRIERSKTMDDENPVKLPTESEENLSPMKKSSKEDKK